MTGKTSKRKLRKRRLKVWLIIFFVALVLLVLSRVFGVKLQIRGIRSKQNSSSASSSSTSSQVTESPQLEDTVVPPDGSLLPAKWGSLGSQLVKLGVIDQDKFTKLYASQDVLSEKETALLTKSNNGEIKITPQNSGVLLNLFWALGLGNQNEILDNGPMQNPRYGGAGNFASTGGWTLAKGSAMDHYSKHKLITLTSDQQALVKKISDNIYRPCCDNATSFPDCNHGMAMLGLVELLASQSVGEQKIYQVALKVNSYWFPGTYITIANYFNTKGINWQDVKPQDVLGKEYSSATGYKKISSEIAPTQLKGGGSCSV